MLRIKDEHDCFKYRAKIYRFYNHRPNYLPELSSKTYCERRVSAAIKKRFAFQLFSVPKSIQDNPYMQNDNGKHF